MSKETRLVEVFNTSGKILSADNGIVRPLETKQVPKHNADWYIKKGWIQGYKDPEAAPQTAPPASFLE